MAYPYPSTIDTTSILGILTYLNAVTRGWFSNMILLSLYIITIYGYYKAKDRLAEGIAIAGYFVFVVALFFWIGGWLSVWVFVIVIALAIIGTLALLTS